MAGRRQDSPLVVSALLASLWLIPAALISLLAFVFLPQSGSMRELPAPDERVAVSPSELAHVQDTPPVLDPFVPALPHPPESESPPRKTVPARSPESIPFAEVPKPQARPSDAWQGSLMARQLGRTRSSTPEGESEDGEAGLRTRPPRTTASTSIPQRKPTFPVRPRSTGDRTTPDASAEATEEKDPVLVDIKLPVPRAGVSGPTFSVHRIHRSDFPLARALHERKRRGEVMSGQRGLLSKPAGARTGEFSLWDDLRVRLSGTASRPAQGRATHQSETRLALTKILSSGRLHVQADVVDREGRFFVAQRGLSLETFGHWWFAAGDHPLPQGTAGINGTQARSLHVQRRARRNTSSSTWKSGGMLGRLPLTYSNMERDIFPRNIAALYGRIEQSNRFHLHGLLYSLSDPKVSEVTSGPAIHNGAGASLSGAIRHQRFNVLGQLHGSNLNLHERDDEPSLAANISAGGQLGPFGLGARLQGTGGTPYDIDYHGALQPTPGLIQEGNLSFRSRAGLSMNAWAGRWANPVVSEMGIEGPQVHRVSASGEQVGARTTWKIRRIGTAVSFSRENRWRQREEVAQNVVSTGASISQQLRHGLAASVHWNRIRYSDRGPHDYLTGDLSLRLGRRLLISLQQRTLWREPYGARVESIFDVSGVHLLDGRLTLSGQLAVTQDRSDADEFRQSQWQSRFHADLRLSDRFRLTSRYHVNRSDFGDIHNFYLGLAHSPNPMRSEFSRAADPRVFERPLLKGHVFEDLNGDGKRQEGEPGIPGVEVAVDEQTRQPLTCDVEGACRALVLPGRHTLRVMPASVPTEFLLRGIGPVEVEVIQDRPTEFAIPLKRRVGAILGRVVDDNTGEGLRDVKVLLGERDFTFTGMKGVFRFGSLPAGEYELRLDPQTLPFGHRPKQEVTTTSVGDPGGDDSPLILHTYRPIRRVEF